jgi:glycosyltransferase involved in cell wall biosynthesis
VVIPTYNNPRTVRRVVIGAREHLPDVIVVDDGSAAEARQILEAIASEGLAWVIHRDQNGGKGAAVKTGLRAAHQAGFTHAVQVDADGQHDVQLIPGFLDAARQDPRAVVLGCPEYDGSVPKGRLFARKITTFWVNLETGGGKIKDSMVGFRVYPLDAAIAVRARGNRMDFDIEIAVRLAWAGTPVVNLPTPVRYLPASEGGVSHFRVWRDNLRISWLHTRLTLVAIGRSLRGLFSKPRS